MARIAEEELARLKRDADLVGLVRASGVELAPCGEDLRGKCPWHDDSTPSLVISPGKGLWHCMGACGIGGSALDWIMRTQGVSVKQAIDLLHARDVKLTPASARVKKSTVPHLPVPVALDADDQGLLNDVVTFYHESLKGPAGEAARRYLTERGLVSSEMVDRFKLGYANRSLGYRLPRRNRKSAGEVRRRLMRLGIFREKTGHEHLNGCVIVPVFDEPTAQGDRNVVGLYGRKAGRDAAEPLHLYLKGPHRGVWNVEALAGAKEITLCEAAFDAMAFWCAGHRAVTWAYGAEGFTKDHLAAFRRYGTEKVIIAYDRDEGGDRAAEKLAPVLADAGIDVYRALFPRTAKDANEYAQKVTPASESLGLVLRSARFMVKGKRAAAPPFPDDQGRNALGSGPAEEVSSAPLSDSACEEASAPRVEVLDDAPAPAEPLTGTCEPSAAAAAPLPEAATPPSPESSANPSSAPEPLPLAAAPAPREDAATATTSQSPLVAVHGDEVTITMGDRVYRVLDLWRNTSLGRMEVTLRVSDASERYYLDAFDLVKARARENFTAQASAELGIAPEVVKKDLGRLLLELEGIQQKRLARGKESTSRNVEIPVAEKEEAFALLHDPRLLDRVVEGFDRIGLVGERPNKLVGYLAATSRKMDDPLAVLIQSNSAAGKSTLMDAVLELMPPEDVERFTAMTGQSLYYLADSDLKHKILAIAEVAGAEKAGYAIKMLQSEGKISIATTVKDPDTGEMKTKKHEVEGPVAVFLTTTEAAVDEELQNRAIVLTVNEDREQTRAIHEAQRRAQTLPGLLARRKREAVVRLHRNAQRLLRPLLVVNPFANGLTFLDTKLRTRRDHAKYLALIRAVALLHQYQRPIHQTEDEGQAVPYIEVTLSDIAIAHHLANDAIGRSLDDLSPPTRRLVLLLDEMVTQRCAERKVAREDLRFTRREVREHTSWGDTQLRVHLARLLDLEFLLVHRGSRGHSFVYELLYDGKGKDGAPFLVGLLDPEALKRQYDPRNAGGNGRLAGV